MHTTLDKNFVIRCESISARADRLIEKITNEDEDRTQAKIDYLINEIGLLELRLEQLVRLHNHPEKERH